MNKLNAPLLFLSGLFLLNQVVACSDDDDDDELPIEVDCTPYCERAMLCDEDEELDECISDCEEFLGNCRADQIQNAQDQLDVCAEETCDEFTECTIDAGLQCYFGL